MLAGMLVILSVLSWTLPSAAAEEQRTIRVGFPQSEGFCMTAPDGRRYGLVVDFLNEIAKYTGWKYEYVDTDSETMLDHFFAGEFELLGGTYYSEGFEEYFAYPEYNCGYSKLILYARRGDDRIKSYDLNTFDGRTIGVFERNEENIRRLKEYLKLNDMDCTLKYFTYEELEVTGNLSRFLENGEVDLLLGNSTAANEMFTVAASFDSQPHYIVTNPGNREVLDGLNMALQKIYEGDADFAKKEYEANFTSFANRFAGLNNEEKEYVAEKKAVSVAVPVDWHPMFCVNSNDGHNGLIPDMLQEITAFSGLEFTYRYCDSYAESLDLLRRGEVDMLGFFTGTEEEAAGQELALSAPYAELDSILVRNRKSSYPAQGLIGAVQEGHNMPEGITADEVRYYTDSEEALADVNSGKVDFYYGASAHLESIIQKRNFTNVVQVTLINDSFDVGFAVKSPAQPNLLTILNKAVNSLTEEQRTAINSRNIVSIGAARMTPAGIIYANPVLAVCVVAAFLLIIFFAVVLNYRSRLHAAAMRSGMEKAEADSRSKSEFLSRMSHDIRTPMNAIVGLTELTEMLPELPDKAKENLGKIKASSGYLLGLINDILDMSRIENGKMEIAAEPFFLHSLLDGIEGMMEVQAAEKELHFRLEKDVRDDMLIGDAIRLRQVLLNLLSNSFKFTPAGGNVRLRVTEEGKNEQGVTLTFRVSDTGIGIAQQDQRRIFNSFEQIGPNIAKTQGTGLGLSISSNIVQLMGGELKLISEPDTGSEFYFTISFPEGEREENPTPEETAALPDGEILRGVSILVAEDNDLNAEIVTELLSLKGASVRRARNGQEAVNLFSESGQGSFDVILMDILMPQMNGLEATRAIRALPRRDAGLVPIIAMTANTFRQDVETAYAAGMTGFVPKPVDVAHLYRELQKGLENVRREAED